jgi:hypothetical protein
MRVSGIHKTSRVNSVELNYILKVTKIDVVIIMTTSFCMLCMDYPQVTQDSTYANLTSHKLFLKAHNNIFKM